MERYSCSILKTIVLSLLGCTVSAANGAAEPTEHVPFPLFSAEPVTRDQCTAQFTDNCSPEAGTVANCPSRQGLHINCNRTASAEEIKKMALAMSQPPTKAVKVTLYDGDQVVGENLAAVRERVVILDISNCTSVRTTGKLSKLRLPNVLDFKLHNCYNLEIVRSDFWQSMQLRVIAFANTTIASLERNTFTDLPALQAISLEANLGTIMSVFNEPMRGFLQRLHCGCEYAWYRKWWANRKLLHQTAKGDVYQIGGNSWDNEERSKTDMYLPINCAVDPFPVDVAAIDFTQESFTVNEDFYLDKWHSGCAEGSEDSEESYPEFSQEPMSPEEIAEWEGANFSDHRVDRMRQVSLAIAKLPPRPVSLLIGGNRTSLTFDDLAPIRKQVVRIMVSYCSDSRATKTLAVLRLTNLLEYEIMNCDDLDVKNNDFLHSKKLRVIFFIHTTIRTLEPGTFTNLPALKLLSLECYVYGDDTFSQPMREYLWRTHCSCEWAWYRQWWMKNPALMHGVDSGGIWNFYYSQSSVKYNRTDIYIPIDCAVPIPNRPQQVNTSQIDYSKNAQICQKSALTARQSVEVAV